MGFSRLALVVAIVAGVTGCVLDGPATANSDEALSADLDAWIAGKMVDGGYPGLSAAIVKNGTIAWQHVYGTARYDTATAVNPGTLFMLGSVSKTLTGTALLQLYEKGRFGLDDDIDQYLPFPVRNPQFPSTPITFRMLLDHTSSIQDNNGLLTGDHIYVFDMDSPIPLGTYVRDRLVPGGAYYSNSYYATFAPCTAYRYSNFAVALVGYLVETISSTPFDQYCNTHIFGPLGMDETSWFLAGLDRSHIAMPYTCSGQGANAPLPCHAEGYYAYPDYPDGQLRTSAAQLALYLEAVIGGGKAKGTRILKSSTVDLMLTPNTYSADGESQGLIWYSTDNDGETVWGHTGADRGVTTVMFFRPTDGAGVIVLGNGTWNGSSAMRDIRVRLFAEATNM